MRLNPLVSLLVSGLFAAAHPLLRVGRAAMLPATVSLTGLSSRAEAPASEAVPGSEDDKDAMSPLGQLHRVAVILPTPSSDPRVNQAVEAERAMLSRRRRHPSLFAPKPFSPEHPAGKPAPKARRSGNSSRVASDKPPNQNPGSATTSDADSTAVLTPHQLQEVAETIYLDALVAGLQNQLGLVAAPEAGVRAALKELHLTPVDGFSRTSVDALCARLSCDAVVVPKIDRLRQWEGETRRLSLWARVQVLLPTTAARASGPTVRAPANTPPISPQLVRTYPAAGAASGERAPFQDRYLKDWPQLAQEAARQASSIALRTLVTGKVAPFVHEEDRVALLPIMAPARADALVFSASGRTVVPGMLKNLRTDFSAYYHPDIQPLLPQWIVSYHEASRAMAARRLMPAALWTREETPDVAQTVALGRQLKVRYVLLTRIGDVQLALDDSVPESRSNGGSTGTLPQRVSAESPSETANMDSASAEAIGALIRVSDGSVLWNARTTATMTVRRMGSQSGAERSRVALDAVRFSLVQLQRRFHQYRMGFE